jgi:low affinity Fe/Cu permease
MSTAPSTSPRDRFNRIASSLTSALGSPIALICAAGLIVIWAVSGPFFGFSETWQLVINTGTTIITFLMVFVIQASQNRDSKALHLKLDEVIRAVEGARNELIGAETSSEQQIREKEVEFLQIAERGGVAAIGTARPGETAEEAAHKAAVSSEVRTAARDAAEPDVEAPAPDRPTTGHTHAAHPAHSTRATRPKGRPGTASPDSPATSRSGSMTAS